MNAEVQRSSASYRGPLSWQNEGSTQACLLQSWYSSYRPCILGDSPIQRSTDPMRGLMDTVSHIELYFDDFNHKGDLFSDQMLNIWKQQSVILQDAYIYSRAGLSEKEDQGRERKEAAGHRAWGRGSSRLKVKSEGNCRREGLESKTKGLSLETGVGLCPGEEQRI